MTIRKRRARSAQHGAAIPGAQSGFSLVELLMVCLVGIVVLGVPLTLSVQAFVGQNRASSRSAATDRLESGVGQLLHDMRDAVHPTTITAAGATLTVPIRSAAGGTPTTQTVTWACTAGASCTRQVGAGSATVVIPYLVSASFAPVSPTGATTTPQTDPAYVNVTVGVLDSNEQNSVHSQAVSGATHPITVSDGVGLRNFGS